MKRLSFRNKRSTAVICLLLTLYLSVLHLISYTPVSPLEPKTLVIIMGNLRGGEQAWNSLYRNFLDINNADLALAIGENGPNSDSSMFQRASYVWKFQEYDDWTQALDLITEGDTAWHKIGVNNPYTGNGLFGGCGPHKGSGAIIFWIRWFISNQIKANKLTEKYDRFVITRSDHYYYCAHDLKELDPRFIWVPEGEDYLGGITDRHVIAPADKILDVLNILPPILKYQSQISTLLQNQTTGDLNPEQTIKLRWQEDGLWPITKRFHRMMFTCAIPGDMTSFSVMREHAVPFAGGVHLKYPGEWVQSMATCAWKPAYRLAKGLFFPQASHYNYNYNLNWQDNTIPLERIQQAHKREIPMFEG